MPTRSAPLRLRDACAIALLGCLASCATVENSLSVAEYAGRTLPTRSGEGAQRLAAEAKVDATLRDFVAANGRPDYIHVVDRLSLYVFYVDEDRAVKFERDLLPPSVAHDLGRIPGSLLKMLPRHDVYRIQAKRAAIQRRSVARQRVRRRAHPPAAPAPSTSGRYMSNFDVREIVDRMTSPLTAADPGVRGWRSVRFSDGGTGSAARSRGTRYEVRVDRLIVAMTISSSRTRPPPQARLEVLRANSAVFGAYAQAVTDHVMKLMDRVAADRSGRSRVAERIRGRQLRIDRVPASGLLVYAIRP